MEKKRVSVQIEGRSYSLITTDDEKYVQKVANEVLSHIRNTEGDDEAWVCRKLKS